MTFGKTSEALRQRRPVRLFALAGGFALIGALAGCGNDVELNGKIFDAMGVSPAAQAASRTEPKLAARPGLVVPPDTSRLPQPGSGGVDDANALASLNDPDKKKVLAAAERERLHKAYCSGEMNWQERVRDKDAAPKSPYGPCGMLGDFAKK